MNDSDVRGPYPSIYLQKAAQSAEPACGVPLDTGDAPACGRCGHAGDDCATGDAPAKQTLCAGRGELSFALFSFPAAFLYTWVLWRCENAVATNFVIAACILLFLAAGEACNRNRHASFESRVWMGGTILLLSAVVFRGGNAWQGRELLFLHAFCIYWLICRSGRLARTQTSGFVWFDGLNVALRIPLRHFFLRVQLLWDVLKREKGEKKSTVWTLGALITGGGMFAFALGQLTHADAGFARMLTGVFDRFSPYGAEALLRLAISIPVGAYLTGLLLGMRRVGDDRFRNEADQIAGGMEKLKAVPSAMWTAIIAAFCALYVAFFFVQGSYLFGAFAGHLPAEFTVAEYARQGFFELCRVMALNFSLFWLARRCARTAVPRGPLTILLAESMLLSVTAMSKLGMYIGIFGFTPRRLQSSWLVLVLLTGCVCAAVSLWTQKRTFRAWVLFAAASLVLTCFY